MTAAQFTALTMDDGQHPPTLDQALDLVRGKPDRHIIMEIKSSISSAQEQILLNKLSGLESQVYVNSFASLLSRIQRLKAANPLLNISLATNSPLLPVPAGISGEDPEYTSITAEHVARLHGAGMLANWVADNATAWQTLRDIGVDAIMTNNTSAYLQWATTGCSGVPPQPRDQTPPNVSVSGPADGAGVAATVQVTGRCVRRRRRGVRRAARGRCGGRFTGGRRARGRGLQLEHHHRARRDARPSSSRLATRLATSVVPTSCRWPCTTWTRRPRRRRPRCPGRGAAQAGAGADLVRLERQCGGHRLPGLSGRQVDRDTRAERAQLHRQRCRQPDYVRLSRDRNRRSGQRRSAPSESATVETGDDTAPSVPAVRAMLSGTDATRGDLGWIHGQRGCQRLPRPPQRCAVRHRRRAHVERSRHRPR